MTTEEGLQTLTGQLLATQAMSHVLLVTLMRSDPDLAHNLKQGLQEVYDALPGRLSGLTLQNFELQWEEIHRLISLPTPK